EKHGVAHAQFYRSIGLLGELTRLKGNSAAIGKRDGFFDWIHKIFNSAFVFSSFLQLNVTIITVMLSQILQS
ncbi:hypothetical protein, partial [Duncaniella freteri]|uniref:hypothetical protein n=1 Tax=Duncaniella freteri TaxID=2530391 RepID=UPI002573B57A